MVSKSNISRKNSLVFTTVGTSAFPFNRLLTAISDIETNNHNHQIIIQYGASNKLDESESNKKYIPPNDFINYLKSADYIITHCAAGTLHEIAKYATCMPLIIPRLHKFNEHVDNHQVFLSQSLLQKFPKEYLEYIVTEENLEERIKKYLSKKPNKNILSTIFNTKPNSILNSFIKEIIS